MQHSCTKRVRLFPVRPFFVLPFLEVLFMKVLPQQLRLYAVTDRTWLNGRRLADVVAQAIDGGATFVQLREKCLDEHDLLAEAEELSALCHFRHVPFVIDDNVEVALAGGADGVHVGQSDMAAKRARALLGPDKILGVSAHNAAEALAAQADGADYLGCGAAFVTGTKLDAHPVTAETMRAVTAAVNIPVVAIGGIDAANLLQLQGRGLAGVAVVSAIFAQADPCAASRSDGPAGLRQSP
jgi:thiamine-phosphate pyrophosphorylase